MKISKDVLEGKEEVETKQETPKEKLVTIKKKKGFQPPILHEPIGVPIELGLFDLTPPDYLEAELDQTLLNSIAADWVRTPILVCPETRITEKKLYYPYDGRRRVLALWWLHENGYKYKDQDIKNIPINAVLRDDLTPDISIKLSFRSNKERSDNPITDVTAVKEAADRLGVSPFTKEGRKAIADDLRTTAQVIGKIAKGLQVDHVVFEAFRKGQIKQSALNAILELKDEKDRLKIAERIRLGEELTTSDITEYKQAFTQATLKEAVVNRPTVDFGISNIDIAIEKLESILQTKDTDPYPVIEECVSLLKELK